MAQLNTRFAGLQLSNPLIISSSGLTNSVEKIQQLEQAGAGAVIIKSLFEEQIRHEAGSLLEHTNYPEAQDYLNQYTRSNTVDAYISLVQSAKKAVKIPVIASINCVSAEEWTHVARQLQQAGADALELNINILSTALHYASEVCEHAYFDIVKAVRKNVFIPVTVKIGSHFTNPIRMVDMLASAGAQSVTLFNRFYQPDIDIENLQFKVADIFSTPLDISHSLRWVALVSGNVKSIQVSASTGVHDGAAIIKQLLAGATTVQVCSAIYKHGVSYVSTMLNEVSDWMQRHDYKTIDEFRGIMSYEFIDNPSLYERTQFMRYFSSVE